MFSCQKLYFLLFQISKLHMLDTYIHFQLGLNLNIKLGLNHPQQPPPPPTTRKYSKALYEAKIRYVGLSKSQDME